MIGVMDLGEERAPVCSSSPKAITILTLFITAFLAASCSEEGPTAPFHMRMVDEQVILCSEGLLEKEKRVRVFGRDAVALLADAAAERLGGRSDVTKTCLEIVNLPPEWFCVEVLDEGRSLARLERPDKGTRTAIVAAQRDPWYMRHLVLSCLYVLLTFYTVLAVGLSGGPNHGEHPFIINVLHLVCFLFLGSSWSYPYYHAYLGILIVAIGFSLWAVRLVMARWYLVMTSRVLMLALYIGLSYLINVKTYSDWAEWTSHDGIMLYVKPESRNRVQLIGEQNQVLDELRLAPKMDCWTLCLWRDPNSPKRVRVLEPGGNVLEVLLNKRPEL